MEVETSDSGIASIFRGPVRIDLGGGDDSLTIGNNTAGGHAEFFSSIVVDAGPGTDTTDLESGDGNIFNGPAPVVTNSETQN